MSEERQPWDRWEGESAIWHQRFRKYLLRRQLLPIYNEERVEARKSAIASVPAAWRNAKEKFCWDDRARAWDAYHQRVEEEQWLTKWEAYRERMWNQAQALTEKADLMLRHPHVLQTAERIHVATHAGEQVPVGIVIKPAGWRMRDIAAFYKGAAELAREAVGDAELAINYLTSLGYVITEPGAGDDNDD